VLARWLIGCCSAHTSQRRHPHSLIGSALDCGLRSDLALVEWLWPDMGLSKASRFVRGVWLVAAVLLCVGALLTLLPTELDVSTAFMPADSPPLDRGADEGYLAVLHEESGEADKNPVNADLLTRLVLGLYFFGSSFGLLLTNSRRQGTLCSWGVVGDLSASACEKLPFLGVLRL
jgi:hypothetical protein